MSILIIFYELCFGSRCFKLIYFLNFIFLSPILSQQIIEPEMRHLRKGDIPEWSEFNQVPHGNSLTVIFNSSENQQEYTLFFRQQDVKQSWQILLNNRIIGTLIQDENDLRNYLAIPPKSLLSGENFLKIEQSNETVDDIVVGEVVLEKRPLKEVLNEATVSIEIQEPSSGSFIPAKITVVNQEGVLQSLGAQPNENLAVRPGYIYTAIGKATFGLPAGSYTLYATRGFEFGVDSVHLQLKAGDHVRHKLGLSREVNTDGWISSDTHIHTYTHSGHGDASIEERAITIAGEGIELPVLTDHNKHISLEPVAKKLKLQSWFTSVTGNELTTPVGHFNIFPVEVDIPVPDHNVKNWQEVNKKIAPFKEEGKVVILNHAQDVHNDFTPFGKEHHISEAGLNLEGWELPANAMEVVNSGSQQTEWKQLYFNWFGMLNRGHALTSVGSSDSHDVSRYVVGQARTYIRSNSENPAAIDVAEAVKNFREGRVMVSFGLLAELEINDQYGPGDLAPSSDLVKVSVKVSGPAWANVEEIVLYANGEELKRAKINNTKNAGEKWSGNWNIPRPQQDLFLVAVAYGSGNRLPFWPIAKPYQPDSPEWKPSFIGSSGAVWVDADGDGKRTSAHQYAKTLLETSRGNIPTLFKMLNNFDKAVAIQVASLLYERGDDLTGPRMALELKKASPATAKGFDEFISALRISDELVEK